MLDIRRTAAPQDHNPGADFVAFLEAQISGPSQFQEKACLMMTATHGVEERAVSLTTIPTEWLDSKELAEARAKAVARALGLNVLYLPPESRGAGS